MVRPIVPASCLGDWELPIFHFGLISHIMVQYNSASLFSLLLQISQSKYTKINSFLSRIKEGLLVTLDGLRYFSLGKEVW